MVIETKVVIGWFKLQLWMWLAYCLSNNNLASELVENRSLLNQPQSRRLWFLWLQWIKIRSANESPIYLLVKCNRVSSLRLVQRHTYMVTAYGNLKNIPCSQTTTSREPSMLQFCIDFISEPSAYFSTINYLWALNTFCNRTGLKK